MSLSLLLLWDPSYWFVWVLAEVQPGTCIKPSYLFNIVYKKKNLDLPVLLTYVLSLIPNIPGQNENSVVFSPAPS